MPETGIRLLPERSCRKLPMPMSGPDAYRLGAVRRLAMPEASMQEQPAAERLYTLCLFGPNPSAPEVRFLDARSDEEALLVVRSQMPWMTRELWERHRLVRVLPPTC
jgi:hypothetical protein